MLVAWYNIIVLQYSNSIARRPEIRIFLIKSLGNTFVLVKITVSAFGWHPIDRVLAHRRWRNLNWIRKELCSKRNVATNLYFDRKHFTRHRSLPCNVISYFSDFVLGRHFSIAGDDKSLLQCLCWFMEMKGNSYPNYIFFHSRIHCKVSSYQMLIIAKVLFVL